MAAAKSVNAESEPPTTIMVRNIPRHYVAQQLAKELRRFLTPSDIDFVYVPWNKTSTNNMGFGFANLRSASIARSALSRLASQPWRYAKHNRKMRVLPAHVHGLALNLQRFKREVADRGGLVMEHAPIVFEDGAALKLDEAFARYCSEGEMAGETAPPVQTPQPARPASRMASEAAPAGHAAQLARQNHKAGVRAVPGLNGANRERSRGMLAGDRQECDVTGDTTYSASFRVPPGLENVLPLSPPGLSVTDRPDGGNSSGAGPDVGNSASFQADVSHGCDFLFDSDSDTDVSNTEMMRMQKDFSSLSDLPSFDSFDPWAARLRHVPAPRGSSHRAWLGSTATRSSLGSSGPWPSAKIDMLTNGSFEPPVPTLCE